MFRYTVLAPLLSIYIDDRKRDLLTVERQVPGIGYFRIALIGPPSQPELVRTELVGANDEGFNQEQAWEEARLVDHLLSVYRLTTDRHIDYLWLGQGRIWFDTKGNPDPSKPRFSAVVSAVSEADHQLELRSASLLFDRSADQRPLIKLLSDSQQPQLPISYRYLSVYKALELEFKVGKKWPKLGELLAPFESEYRALNISKKNFENYIHEVRDLCAHIKLDNADEARGITGLNSAEYPRVEKLFELLKKIAFHHLTTKFPVAVTGPNLTDGFSMTRVTAPEAKVRLEERHSLEKADELKKIALYWELEAGKKAEVVSNACLDLAKQARFLAGLLSVRAAQ